MTIEIENGQLRWTPKIVLFKGKLYKAPLDLLPYLVYNTILKCYYERIKITINHFIF